MQPWHPPRHTALADPAWQWTPDAIGPVRPRPGAGPDRTGGPSRPVLVYVALLQRPYRLQLRYLGGTGEAPSSRQIRTTAAPPETSAGTVMLNFSLAPHAERGL